MLRSGVVTMVIKMLHNSYFAIYLICVPSDFGHAYQANPSKSYYNHYIYKTAILCSKMNWYIGNAIL